MLQEPHSDVSASIQGMGSRQAVRHVALDHAFGGSNPPSPAMPANAGCSGGGLEIQLLIARARLQGGTRAGALALPSQTGACKELFEQRQG
jgi:hypothetical protein